MNELVTNFKKSLFEKNIESIGELSEILIDSVIEDGVLKDLPIAGTISSFIKITKSINDRNLLKQTLQFIKEFNSGSIDFDKLKSYKDSINNDRNKAEEELGRVLIILNNFIDLEKSKMLANVFRSYVNGVISWDDFCEFSEIIKNLMLKDIDYIYKIYTGKLKNTSGYPLYPFNRLGSLGLIDMVPNALFPVDSEGSYYRRDYFVSLSAIGGKFYQVVNH